MFKQKSETVKWEWVTYLIKGLSNDHKDAHWTQEKIQEHIEKFNRIRANQSWRVQ